MSQVFEFEVLDTINSVIISLRELCTEFDDEETIQATTALDEITKLRDSYAARNLVCAEHCARLSVERGPDGKTELVCYDCKKQYA